MVCAYTENTLNVQQKSVLEHPGGALLVLAGAGSGKTTLITQKYINLLKDANVEGKIVFTITYNNKAANEMEREVKKHLPEDFSPNDIWLGTYNSICRRILREDIDRIGISRDFTIYNDDDQARLIKHILSDMKLYEALYKGVASKLSSFKMSLLTPEDLMARESNFDFDEKMINLYVRYQDEMRRSNALDYEDLILYTIRLFKEQPEVLKKYRHTLSYLLVDEFQETNRAQYKLLCLLTGDNRNICVAGDYDQSLNKCKWDREGNVLSRFMEDFPDSKVIQLDQTFRCTENILNVSRSIITVSSEDARECLWTEKGCGEKVFHYWFTSEDEEAKYISQTIKDIYLKGTYAYDNIAIFYRVNLQSRRIEDALKKERIPYNILGAHTAYHQREIRTVIAYLRLMINKDDNVCLREIINVPNRGIGATTLKKIENLAKKEGLSLFGAIETMCEGKTISSNIREKLCGFSELLKAMSDEKPDNVAEAIKLLDSRVDYLSSLKNEVLEELYKLIEKNHYLPLRSFLDNVSLTTGNDDNPPSGGVSLTTLDNVKGLEYSIVFITGLEDGLLPYFKATDSQKELDDERKLFYVGMTRAKDLLFMTGAGKRKLYATYQDQEPSRFLSEIPRECCKWFEKKDTLANLPLRSISKKTPPPALPYNTGCRVKHPKWGVGVIRDCYGEKSDIKVTVNFPDVGIKRLALKYANLERI